MKAKYYNRKQVYDHLVRILTDYEMPEDEDSRATEEDLYYALVDVVENWDDLTGDEDTFQIEMHF